MVNNGESRTIELCSQMGLGHGHAHSHAHACPQGARGGLHALRMSILRMPRRKGTILTELLHILHGQSITEEMQQGVKQCRAMPAGKDEAVTVLPLRIPAIVAHVIRPEFIGHRRSPQGQPRMAGFRLLYGIRRQNPDCIHTSRIHVCQKNLLHSFMAQPPAS